MSSAIIKTSSELKQSVNDRMRGIARELSMELFEVEEVLERWKISRQQFEAILRHPAFEPMLQQARIEWGSADNTVKRTQLKAAIVLEQALPELNARLHDRSEPLNAKVELAKFLGRMGGMDKSVNGAGGGDSFKIEINLGGDNKVNIEKVLPVRVIEAEAE